MIILYDTREQKPLEFNHPYITSTERTTLKVGDYGVMYRDGYVPPVFFERKSLPDLFGTLGKGHERFNKEIARAKKLGYILILVIEGTYGKIKKGISRSQIPGITIIRMLMTMRNKYNLEFHCLKDREEMADFIAEWYAGIGRLKGKRHATIKK